MSHTDKYSATYTELQVYVTDFGTQHKDVLAFLVGFLGYTNKRSRATVKSAPIIIMYNVLPVEAENILIELSAIGVTAEAKAATYTDVRKYR